LFNHGWRRGTLAPLYRFWGRYFAACLCLFCLHHMAIESNLVQLIFDCKAVRIQGFYSEASARCLEAIKNTKRVVGLAQKLFYQFGTRYLAVVIFRSPEG